ncbi:uncharacterized protein DNG_02488 [Cephalotrichum gorgonifer]|uniref:N-acetyltransferase domain-containing protein n=1 Tax=Cephalotrichum gorgonifer TaxID=2041049 RepID=A0AAE8SSP0_9PEZI|nr:uncharacterized protein DNG_02488 [Cephalotrichum gorgonifer]
MDYQRHMAVPELDLRTCSPSIVDKLNSVPALKTSTAFFTFLRANLAINPSTLSQANTPILEPTSSFPVSSSPQITSPLATTPPLVPIDDIPQLSLEVLHDSDSRTDALQLVADSVSQQRPQAALSLALHPVCISGLAGSLALSYSYLHATRPDLTTSIMACAAIVALYGLAVHYATVGYRRLAEEVIPAYSPPRNGTDRDIILGARMGDEIVGALVLRLEPSPIHGRRRGRHLGLRGGKGVIRAWTTSASHRGEGIGRDLLAKAARLTKEKCGREAAVGFAREHANSAVVLPEVFNGSIRRQERRATKALEGVLANLDVGKKKR